MITKAKKEVMKKFRPSVFLFAALLLSPLFTSTTQAQQPPAYFAGSWTMYVTGTLTGQTEVRHVQITQFGNQVSGYFEGENQAGPINGEITGNQIHFITATRQPINFRGHIFGNTITGEYIFHGNRAPWQAVRAAGIGYAPQPVVTYQQPVVATVPQNSYAPGYTASAQYNTQPAAPPPQPQSYAPQSAPPPQQQSYAPQNTAPPQDQSYAPQNTDNSAATAAPAPTPAPMSADQLDALVAPIALYPDSLVAQVLAAAAMPDEVTAANQWLSQNASLTGDALEQAVEQQDWDPSVKALTQFPSVLANLAGNLSWTSSLGQAFHFQQADVMQAVQVMRARAQAAGTLQSTSQITVTTPAANTIVIQPANPQVVYVPQYNPAIVYGAQVVVPWYTPPVVYSSPVLNWGVGVTFGGGGWAVGGGFGWGFHAWACNWGGGGGGNTIIFNHTTYINNNTWHTTNYNGYHPWGPGPYHPGGYVGPNGAYHPDPGWRPGTDTNYGPHGAYHPNGYFGPDGGWHPYAPGSNPNHQPNGGDNGNHGLIGGNGGVQHTAANGGAVGPENHAWYGNNGSYHPSGDYKPGQDTHYGPNGGYHPNGYYGPDGGWHTDKASSPQTPNGGHNGDHGLIGGNGGVQHNNNPGNSRMSGDGRTNQAESNRGRTSMARQQRQPQQRQPRPQHVEHAQHAPAEHHPSGGGGRRR
jgi:Protein of unknown function (DUF3300)